MNALAVLLFLAPFQGVASLGTGGIEDFVLTEQRAYMVLPPQAVGGAQTLSLSWSSSGRYLLMSRLNPPISVSSISAFFSGGQSKKPVQTVMLWDKSSNRTSELGSIPIEAEGKFQWITGQDVTFALVVEQVGGVDQERASLVRIDAASAKLHFIPIANPIPAQTFYRIVVSPVDSRAILIETTYTNEDQSAASTVLSIDKQGRTTSKARLPNGFVSVSHWLKDGNACLAVDQPSTPGARVRNLVSYDLESGTVAPANDQMARFQPSADEPPLKIVRTSMQSSVGTIKKAFNSIWLKSTKVSERGEYLLDPRADMGILNSSLDAVAVLDQGVVTVRMLASLPKEVYFKAVADAERARALSEAKQIGLGAHMFAADNDDRLPSRDEFANGALAPYLKNNGFFEGFTYTLNGGLMKDVKNPSGTMLGYKPVAGGFAIVFADGHAKWLKELPKGP